MSISLVLREVLERDYSGNQSAMAREWGVSQETLNRWLRGVHVPASTEYALLAEKLGLSIEEVWRLCQEERRLRQLVAS